MCRYAWHNYRDHFACFDCRKAFKYWQWEHVDQATFHTQQRRQRVPREIVCPDCTKPMVDMGLDFRAPSKSDVEAWQVFKALAESGFTFHGCGCRVGFSPPQTLREVPAWIEDHRRKSAGEKLLQNIDKRVRAKRAGRVPAQEPKFRLSR